MNFNLWLSMSKNMYRFPNANMFLQMLVTRQIVMGAVHREMENHKQVKSLQRSTIALVITLIVPLVIDIHRRINV